MSDPDYFEFYWDNDELNVEAVLRPGIDSPFTQTAFDDLEMEGSAANLILIHEVVDKETFLPTTPAYERATRPPALLRIRSIGTRKKVFRIMFIEISYSKYCCVCVLI